MMKVFTVFDLMEILKISEPTARRLLKSGDLKSIKVGGQIRITEESLNDFLRRETENEVV